MYDTSFQNTESVELRTPMQIAAKRLPENVVQHVKNWAFGLNENLYFGSVRFSEKDWNMHYWKLVVINFKRCSI